MGVLGRTAPTLGSSSATAASTASARTRSPPPRPSAQGRAGARSSRAGSTTSPSVAHSSRGREPAPDGRGAARSSACVSRSASCCPGTTAAPRPSPDPAAERADPRDCARRGASRCSPFHETLEDPEPPRPDERGVDDRRRPSVGRGLPIARRERFRVRRRRSFIPPSDLIRYSRSVPATKEVAQMTKTVFRLRRRPPPSASLRRRVRGLRPVSACAKRRLSVA